MRTVITGGSGLIGRALTESLVADGHEVVILSRTPERVSNLPATVRVEHWDGQTAAGWAHLADGAKAIVNLAGENISAGRWTAERKERIRESESPQQNLRLSSRLQVWVTMALAEQKQ